MARILSNKMYKGKIQIPGLTYDHQSGDRHIYKHRDGRRWFVIRSMGNNTWFVEEWEGGCNC